MPNGGELENSLGAHSASNPKAVSAEKRDGVVNRHAGRVGRARFNLRYFLPRRMQGYTQTQRRRGVEVVELGFDIRFVTCVTLPGRIVPRRHSHDRADGVRDWDRVYTAPRLSVPGLRELLASAYGNELTVQPESVSDNGTSDEPEWDSLARVNAGYGPSTIGAVIASQNPLQ